MSSPSRSLPEGLAGGFERRFGRRPEVAARAPGRVNLIGEHTDYNDGLVLPCAIDRDTWVLASARTDDRVRVWSRESGEEAGFSASAPRRAGGWIDYVQGVWCELGVGSGADLLVASEVPLESGLSSSAALTVAVATALDACAGLGLPPLERAMGAWRAESRFVGVGCGVMDPMASALGRRDGALRIDCRDLSVEIVGLPADRLALLLVHSGVRRSLQVAGYAERRHECERALAAARDAGVAAPGASALRDLGPEDLPALERALDRTLFRRARHVVLENARVEAACRALEAGDLEAVGSVLRAGMQSLRDDFAVSCPELDALCELGDGLPGVYGSRLTGAGFGGCSLHLVAPGSALDAAEALAAGFETRFGRRPRWLLVAPADGAEAARL